MAGDVGEAQPSIAQLAEVLEGRGYEVNLGNGFGGEICEIIADRHGGPVDVKVIDFGRDPAGRPVDIRWVSPKTGKWEFIESPIEAEDLADRIVATL
jgi:hypothetical protein